MATVLETFDGYVDDVRDGIAHLTLMQGDETLWGELPVEELEALGIKRRFLCETVETGSGVDVRLTPILDLVLTPEEMQRICAETEALLGGDDGPQNDY